jgi:hypothetical protein
MKQIINQLFYDIVLDNFIVINILKLTYFFFQSEFSFLKKIYTYIFLPIYYLYIY